MTSIAILIGNAAYEHENDLLCCAEDVKAMTALVEATGRFDEVHTLTDLDGDAIREVMRNTIVPSAGYDEIFFYFSGHGAQIGGELYYCGKNFDGGRPNETGVSHFDVLSLLRPASPKLLVKVIDACYSGALLVKAERPVPFIAKEGFRNVLQFSSSKDDQVSWGGERLSAFTRAFLEASVRKTDGAVYYSDIANTLRDNFLENEDQTPFFFNQGTGREALVMDANLLKDFKDHFNREWGISNFSDETAVSPVPAPPPSPPTFEELLAKAEQRMTSPDGANALIGKIFDGVVANFDATELAGMFTKDVSEYKNYTEPSTEEFLIRVLARESRPDRLVTAEIERVKKRSSPWDLSAYALASLNPEWTEDYTLSLNCSLDRAQLCVSLTPKYRSLQQMKLVLSCAPSLEHCYLFELVTLHPRTDWEEFSSSGIEAVRRWYKLEWRQSVDHVVQKICNGLTKSIEDHINATAKRLSDGRD